MLFKFKSKASADLIMLEADGRRLLKAMIGDDPVQGIVRAADLPAALARLEAAVAEQTAQFEGQDVPRPEHWTGWRVMPDSVEFWRDRPFRLHDRLRFDRHGQGWTKTRLWP